MKKWKQLAVEGTVLMRTPPGVVCTECASRKHMCEQKAYVLPARVGKGVGDDEVHVKVETGRG